MPIVIVFFPTFRKYLFFALIALWGLAVLLIITNFTVKHVVNTTKRKWYWIFGLSLLNLGSLVLAFFFPWVGIPLFIYVNVIIQMALHHALK